MELGVDEVLYKVFCKQLTLILESRTLQSSLPPGGGCFNEVKTWGEQNELRSINVKNDGKALGKHITTFRSATCRLVRWAERPNYATALGFERHHPNARTSGPTRGAGKAVSLPA